MYLYEQFGEGYSNFNKSGMLFLRKYKFQVLLELQKLILTIL